MADFEQRFRSRWRLPGEAGEVFDVLLEAAAYALWWGSVHASARMIRAGDARGEGRVVELVSGARVPLLLRSRLTFTRIERPFACALSLEGDVQGQGEWRLVQDGPYVEARLAWRVRTRNRAAGAALLVLAPLLQAEYGWAMRKGEIAIQLELRRRHAATARERAMVPYPSGAAVREASAAGEPMLPGLEPREPVS
jgi:hypothetical protein